MSPRKRKKHGWQLATEAGWLAEVRRAEALHQLFSAADAVGLCSEEIHRACQPTLEALGCAMSAKQLRRLWAAWGITPSPLALMRDRSMGSTRRFCRADALRICYAAMKKQITISAALAESKKAGAAVPTRSMVITLIPSADVVDMHADACARLREQILSCLAECPSNTQRKTKGRAIDKAASRAARLHAVFEAAPDLDNRIRRDRHLSSKLSEFRWPGGGRRGVLQSLAKWRKSPTKETLVPKYISESKAFNLREVYSLALQALSANVTCAKMRECILEADPAARVPSSVFCQSKTDLCARVDGIAVQFVMVLSKLAHEASLPGGNQ